MQENINKAASTISYVIADLRAASKELHTKDAASLTLGDKALMAHLNHCMEQANRLQNDLMMMES